MKILLCCILVATSVLSSSATDVKIGIGGAVEKPGYYNVNRKATVQNLLWLAGGPMKSINATPENIGFAIIFRDDKRITVPLQEWGEKGSTFLPWRSGDRIEFAFSGE